MHRTDMEDRRLGVRPCRAGGPNVVQQRQHVAMQRRSEEGGSGGEKGARLEGGTGEGGKAAGRARRWSCRRVAAQRTQPKLQRHYNTQLLPLGLAGAAVALRTQLGLASTPSSVYSRFQHNRARRAVSSLC